MNYFIKRDLNEYGPYSLADLQKYVGTGNILVTDLCRSEGLTDWVPVSQVIGNIPVPAAPQAAPAYTGAPTGGGYAPVAVSQYPSPPSLHWGAVLALTICTCWIFGFVWLFLQAAWAKKVDAASKALLLFTVGAALYVGVIITGFSLGVASISNGAILSYAPLLRIVDFAAWIAMLVGCFNLKNTIEQHYNTAEPIALSLSGVITFVMAFFGLAEVYFQYHFTKIDEMKRQQMGYAR